MYWMLFHVYQRGQAEIGGRQAQLMRSRNQNRRRTNRMIESRDSSTRTTPKRYINGQVFLTGANQFTKEFMWNGCGSYFSPEATISQAVTRWLRNDLKADSGLVCSFWFVHCTEPVFSIMKAERSRIAVSRSNVKASGCHSRVLGYLTGAPGVKIDATRKFLLPLAEIASV